VHRAPPRGLGQAARWAATPWQLAATEGCQPTLRPNTVVLGRNPGPVPDFIFSFLFDLVKFPKKV
jgi:hypothetical protein